MDIKRLSDIDKITDIVNSFMNCGIFAKSYMCPKCDVPMKIVINRNTLDGVVWRCKKFGNNKHDVLRSVRKGSWLEKSKLDLKTITKLIYYWFEKASNQTICKELQLSKPTVVDWKQLCRDVCVERLLGMNEKLGGCGKTVEIGESKFGSNRAKRVSGRWVFGGIERGSRKCFLKVVDERSKSTLLEIIKENVLPDTVIISDCWESYNCLADEGINC